MSRAGISLVLVAACASASLPAGPNGGVIFTYPIDGQLDVPLGTRVVATFSEPVNARAIGMVGLVGPSGAVNATAQVSSDGASVLFDAPPLDAGTTYSLMVPAQIDPSAQNLPAAGMPLVTFTTRSDRPRAAPPTLVAVNGSDPKNAGAPLFETTTIRLLFSEPLDPRSVQLAPGAIELVDATGAEVAATLVTDGIHVSIDPVNDLTAGATYTLELGAELVDLGGRALAPTSIALVPQDSLGTLGPVHEVMRVRQNGDPGPTSSRSGTTPNTIAISKPLIGAESSQLGAAVLDAELGDPQALADKSIAFTIRRGARLTASGLDVRLGGSIPAGVSTGDIQIELVTDGGGRLYRNPHRSPDQIPDDARAPIYVDLRLDIAIYATDPVGNAVLAQTVLGVQASGTVTAADGVLDIETVASMELALLGVTKAPTNFVLELITDASATPVIDASPPKLVATHPSAATPELPVDEGPELIFDEPIDLDRARAGGVRLLGPNGTPVVSVIESHGSAIVVRPIAPLAYSTSYTVALDNVTDVAGNSLAATAPVVFATPHFAPTNDPLTATAVHPGAPCALTGGTSTSPGHCVGRQTSSDDLYQPFQLAANQPIVAVMTQPIVPSSVEVVAACGIGSVRVEQVDGGGACTAAAPGTLDVHDRTLVFWPDVAWTQGTTYALTLASNNGGSSCNSGDLCGPGNGGESSSFDPLNGTQGTGAAGGPDLVAPFVGAAAGDATFLVATAMPFTDINGSGFVDPGEVPHDENRAQLHIVGTGGSVSSASFQSPDCSGANSGGDACMYLSGSMPVELEDAATSCALPDGTTAPTCVPVLLSPQAMYGTSVAMRATISGVFSTTSDTGTTVLRVREPASGPITGYMVAGASSPDFVVALELYMDAPDLSLPLGTGNDLHSKPLSVLLRGPVSFLADGRIAIAVANQADVPITINISPPIVGNGSIDLVIPAGEMHLQLVSPALRGAAP